VEYSSNTAWVVLDLLISYNALGEAIGTDGLIDDDLVEKYIDIDTFIEAADYCDEVPSGLTDKRFEFNSIFDSKYTIFDAISEVKKACRGGLFVKNNKIQFKIDKAETVSKILTKDDIVPLSETFTSLPIDKICDIFKAEYISPDHEWAKIQAQAELSTHKNRASKAFIQDIYGCKSFEQASRLAWYYANRQILSPYSGSFETGYLAQSFEIGQVITIPVEVLGVDALDVKITSVTVNKGGKFKVEWFNYDADLYNDNMGAQEPTLIVNNINNPYALPDDVADFTASQFLNTVELSWTDDLINTYEIREGSSWAAGTVIATGIKGSSHTIYLKRTGVKKYWIKAFTGFNYSENATLSTLTVQDVPMMNTVVTIDPLASEGGTHSDTKIYNGKLKLAVDSTVQFEDKSPLKFGADNTGFWNFGGLFGATVKSTGNYTTEKFDLGAVLKTSYSFVTNFTGDNDASYTVEIRFSDDDITWTDYEEVLTVIVKEARYYQLKITLNSPNNTPVVFNFNSFEADVPDRIEFYSGLEITDAAAGYELVFAENIQSRYKDPFNIAPAVVVTPESQGEAVQIGWDYENKSAAGVTVKLYDIVADEYITGKFDLVAKAY
jgi:hypothetical protein